MTYTLVSRATCAYCLGGAVCYDCGGLTSCDECVGGICAPMIKCVGTSKDLTSPGARIQYSMPKWIQYSKSYA